ncbi:MAG: hydrogenase maturation protease [Chloroflexi bacterium]|nr:hydrogenase maturation protease [Chloroflexota bacterium]
MKTALVGFGNPCHGDDGIGPAAARRIYQRLPNPENITLLELATSDFGVMEALIGYQRAVIIDALVDETADVGTLRRLELPEALEDGHLSPHTAGFGAAMALARKLGLAVPGQIALYGVVIRQPPSFSDQLSPELQARLDEIARAIAAAEFTA